MTAPPAADAPAPRDASGAARALARTLFDAAVDAVAGRPAVRRELERMAAEPAGLGDRIRLVAFGKAADAMALGALDALGDRVVGGLVVTKHDHLSDAVRAEPRLVSMEASHPVPDADSLAAGEALIEAVRAAGPEEHLLVLISGGGSALVEALVDGVDLAELRRRTDALLAGGAPIGRINRERRALSRIKGGALLGEVRAGRTTQLLISDVPGDRIEDIASGPLVAPAADSGVAVDTRLVATNAVAREAVVRAAAARGLVAVDAGALLDGDVGEAPARLAGALAAHPGADVVVAGGEPTVVLPPAPGRGGRNQQLAALLARELGGAGAAAGGAADKAAHALWLVCGTDGTDGPTDAAGGLVDAATAARAACLGLDLDAALAGADTGPWLEAVGALVRTGPTGTNVMDLAIGVRGGARLRAG